MGPVRRQDEPGRVDIAAACVRLAFLLAALWISPRPVHAAPDELFGRASLTTATLPSGLKVVVREDHSAPLVSVCIAVMVGSRNETLADNGISHFLEHMMFRGSRRYPGCALESAIEGMGGELNGATARDATYFYATVPSAQFRVALDGLADTMIAPTFPDDQIDRERVVVATEIGGSRDRAADVARDLLFRLAYRSHPYGLPVAGTLQALLNVDRDDLAAWHDRWYTADNMAVVIVGDVDPAEAIDRVATAFADLKHAEDAREPIPPEPEPKTRREGREQYNVTHSHLCIGFLTPGSDDLRANCALDVLLFMLGRGCASRLTTAIRDRQGLAQAIGANYVSQHDRSLFEVWAVCEPNQLGALRAAVLRQLADLAKHPPPADELERAKRLLEGVFLRDNESFSQQARTLANYAISGDPVRVADYLPTVRALTAQDVADVAAKYLDVERCTVLIVEPEADAPGGGPGGAPT